MSKIVYVITLEGEPMHVYSNLADVEQECRKYFEERKIWSYVSSDYNDFLLHQDNNIWDEEGYLKEELEDILWDAYIEEQFENGTWGDYAWYEVLMD